MDPNFTLTILSCGGIFLLAFVAIGRSVLRNGCEGRTLRAAQSRDRSLQTPSEACDLCHLKMSPNEMAAEYSAAIS